MRMQKSKKFHFYLHICKKSSKFAAEFIYRIQVRGYRLKVIVSCGMLMVLLMMACNRPSKVEEYRAEKHRMDSVRLEEQVRSMAYYESQLDSLLPVSDSLIALFTYERNEKYQDHGYYVTNGRNGLRILVRDDGKEILLYQNGKRIPQSDDDKIDRAEHLQVVIRDIKELEKRIFKTSLEISKYEKRLTK